MTFAGFLIAVILATSALMKVRLDRRTGTGTSPATLLELVAAPVVAAAPMVTGTLPVNLVVLAFVVSITASLLQVRRYGAIRMRREETEGGRLAAYVRYLSAAEGDQMNDERPEGGDPPADDAAH
jgi:hypothetical protein